MEHPILQMEFAGIPVRVLDVDGEPYIPGEDIGKMLGYEEPRVAVNKIFERHRDELELHSTDVKLTSVDGKLREIRCYNETGAFLIAMFARTDRAKDVRQWLAQLPRHYRELRRQLEAQNYRKEAITETGVCHKEHIPLPEPPSSDSGKAVSLTSYITRQVSTLITFRLPPEILDRLLLCYMLDTGVVYATLVTGVSAEVVRRVFQIFVELGYPKHGNLLPLPWDMEREPYLAVNDMCAEASTVLKRILSLVDYVRFMVGQDIAEDAFFTALDSIAPDWLVIEDACVCIREHVFGGTVVVGWQEVARQLQWSYEERGPGQEVRLLLPRDVFFRRYVADRMWSGRKCHVCHSYTANSAVFEKKIIGG